MSLYENRPCPADGWYVFAGSNCRGSGDGEEDDDFHFGTDPTIITVVAYDSSGKIRSTFTRSLEKGQARPGKALATYRRNPTGRLAN